MALMLNLLLFSAFTLVVQPLPQYRCPSSALQLITNADVSGTVFESSYTANFDEILSVSSYYWGAPVNNLPENATLIFSKPYVLIGLTSGGINISDATYVGTFLLSYSAALNGSFQNLTQPFIASSPLEASFFFEEPILSHRLQVNIISATAYRNGFFYWRMNLIGCPLRNASVILSETSSMSPMPSPSTTFIMSSYSIQSCSPLVTETVTRYVTINQTMAGSPLPSTVITTEASKGSCQGSVAAAVIVPILILIVVAVVLVALFVLYRYDKKKGVVSKALNALPHFNNPVQGKRQTLKEVDNREIYTMERQTDDLTVYSDMYNSISLNREGSVSSKSLPLPSIPDHVMPDNIYSEVNEYEDANIGAGGENALYENPSGTD